MNQYVVPEQFALATHSAVQNTVFGHPDFVPGKHCTWTCTKPQNTICTYHTFRSTVHRFRSPRLCTRGTLHMDLYEATEHNSYLPHIPQYRAPFSVTQALFQRNTAHGSVRSHRPQFVLTTHPAVQSTVFGHPGFVPEEHCTWICTKPQTTIRTYHTSRSTEHSFRSPRLCTRETLHMDLYEATDHKSYLPHIPQYRAQFSVTQGLYRSSLHMDRSKSPQVVSLSWHGGRTSGNRAVKEQGRVSYETQNGRKRSF